jgi:NAD(P)-dependent dehydrogenase (short-subunit alcohol dehydrogenase family)
MLTSSIAAYQSLPLASIYSASKAAVRSLSRSLAAELAPSGIRVNTLTPGAVETQLMNSFPNAEHIKSIMRERRPMKRLGQPHEIATVALFLASSDSSYMTGTETLVAGGRADL